MIPEFSTQSPIILLINQLFELEKKVQKMEGSKKLDRNIRRMKAALEELGFVFHNPIGEAYDETRTDCEASIAGDSIQGLVITEVLKPIIHLRSEGHPQLVQRALVIVEAAK